MIEFNYVAYLPSMKSHLHDFLSDHSNGYTSDCLGVEGMGYSGC